MAQIRWSRGDFIRLGKAIADFNKRIKELETEENRLYLPEPQNFSEEKKNILSRRELNRYINSLKRFNREGAADIYVTEAGEQLTKWERRELSIMSANAQRRLARERESIAPDVAAGKVGTRFGPSRIKEIEATIQSLRKIEEVSGSQFKRLKARIKLQGRSDYATRKDIIFKENYLNMISRYSSYDNYEILKSYLESIPANEFYKTLEAKEGLQEDILYVSDQYYKQSSFTKFVNSIVPEDYTIPEVKDETDEIEFRFALINKNTGKVARGGRSNTKRFLEKKLNKYKYKENYEIIDLDYI